jgi:hypothetical protein
MPSDPTNYCNKGITSPFGTALLRNLVWLSGGVISAYVLVVSVGLFVPPGGTFFAVFFGFNLLLFPILTGLQLVHAILDFRGRRFDRGVGGLTRTAAMAVFISLVALYLGATG